MTQARLESGNAFGVLAYPALELMDLLVESGHVRLPAVAGRRPTLATA